MSAPRLSRQAMTTHNPMTKLLTGAAFATLALAGCNPIQPKPECKAQTGDYAARYTVQDKTADCTDDDIITGEVLSVQYYSPMREGNDKPKLAIIPENLSGALEAGDAAGVNVTTDPDWKQPMGAPSTGALGTFSAVFPNDKNICSIKDLGMYSAMVDMIPKDPMDPMSMDTPPVNVQDAWSGLSMVVTPTSNAVYFGATLARTTGKCTVTYAVTAVSPSVSCEGQMDTTEIDPATGKPKVDPDTGMTVQVGTGKPDETLCVPSDDNGLNVDIDYECDMGSLLCVPANDYPQMKSK